MTLYLPKGTKRSDDPWFGHRWIDASTAKDIRGLEGIAAQVNAGGLPPDTPVMYAFRKMDGGYPDVVIAVPFDRETVLACQRGDKAVARDVVEALEDTFQEFWAQVKAGVLN